jgi:hypothetical protein
MSDNVLKTVSSLLTINGLGLAKVSLHLRSIKTAVSRLYCKDWSDSFVLEYDAPVVDKSFNFVEVMLL